ncbi:DUF805 domain-containing protein [Myroides pelagicus]|uniref:DUF805 domain-containing protein n=1 Tax=Myroides pelagicus TaxID=270914 RepID=A0A7K1GJJ7_9FLAO|nr:DUF805 domain-containing protein [Myroides pelagicus]MEC4113011.1 DUF805 domain-containing protein [Myroides pelagicus]MTH28986.1 DUF805 domain-containing protein [Myroides pelagicus]
MEWYLKVLKEHYADFNGRARRQEYWMFVLFNTLVAFGIIIVGGILTALTDTDAIMQFFVGLYIIYILGTFIPSIAVLVRRLHDTNNSGAYYFMSFIPLVGPILLLVKLVEDGTRGTNQYGVDPKNPNDEINEIGQPKI